MKKNPVVHLSESKLRKIKRECTEQAVDGAILMVLTVLHDKFEFDSKQLIKVLKETNNLSDSMAKGYVSVEDLREMIEEECGISIKNRKETNNEV